MKTPKPEAPPPTPPTDQLGIPLRPDQWPFFDALAQFDPLDRMLANALRMADLLAQSAGGELLRHGLPDLVKARRALNRARPYAAICPYCYAKRPGRRDPDCACQGLPYVNQSTFERAPEGMKDAVLLLVK